MPSYAYMGKVHQQRVDLISDGNETRLFIVDGLFDFLVLIVW